MKKSLWTRTIVLIFFVCIAAVMTLILTRYGILEDSSDHTLIGLFFISIVTFVVICINGAYILWSFHKQRAAYRDFIHGKNSILDIDPSVIPSVPESGKMLEVVNDYLLQESRLKLSQKQAQYIALQNQINPHFLYNTLEAMRGDAIAEGMDQLAGTAEALSDFFRYTMSDSDMLTTVERELNNVRNYFRIQTYRFGDRLKLEISFNDDDEEEILQLGIPKLTLQPIIENSVFHGLEKKVEKGSISIRFEQTERFLYIHVKDSGVGMDKEMLDRLNYSLNEETFKSEKALEVQDLPQSHHSGIALKNVAQRIKLLNGSEYGLHVFSTPDVGTDVEIVLPRKKVESRKVYEKRDTEIRSGFGQDQ